MYFRSSYDRVRYRNYIVEKMMAELFLNYSSQIDGALETETVDSGSAPCRVKRETTKNGTYHLPRT